MPAPAYVSDPQIQYLSQLVEEIADGHLLVPRFQRTIVWTDEQRLELMRSVAKATPIGSILVWRTRETLSFYDRLGPYRLERRKNGEFSSYILDGHQRLSTLFGALKAEKNMKSAQQDPDERCWEILYDLENEDFLLKDDVDANTVYVSLRVLLDSVESLRFQRRLIGLPNAEELVGRFEELASAFQRYKIPIIPIVTDDLDQATFAFQRVNSQGTDMSQVHMIHALTWSADFDLNSRLEEIQNDKLARLGWQGIDNQLILTTCKALLDLDILESNADTISQAFRKEPPILDEAVEHLVRAIDFLTRYCGITSPKLLPYSPLLPLLADGLRFIGEPSEESEEALGYWFWWTIYIGLSGGSNASRMRRAAETVRRMSRDGEKPRELMLPATELTPPPRRFDFRHARAKVLALRMAERRDQVEESTEARQDLNCRGSEMVQPLIPRSFVRALSPLATDRLEALLRGPANRILASPEEAVSIRRQVLEGSTTETARDAHMIPSTALADKGLLVNFLEERLSQLGDLERTFAASLEIVTSERNLRI